MNRDVVLKNGGKLARDAYACNLEAGNSTANQTGGGIEEVQER